MKESMETLMLPAAEHKVSVRPLRLLLVGEREEDFFLIREILSRTMGNRGPPSWTMQLRWMKQELCCNRRLVVWFCSSMRLGISQRFMHSRLFGTRECRSHLSCQPSMQTRTRSRRSFKPALGLAWKSLD
jgi:hypothetical protein